MRSEYYRENRMTFSIVAFDPENGDLGIAVESKFPNVGVVIPFAQAGIGAIFNSIGEGYYNQG